MKKYIKKISIFVILVIISLTTVFYVKADSGWDSDYGGGSDWGDSSWDSSGSYGSDGGSVSDEEFIIVMCIMIPVIIILIIAIYKQRKAMVINNNSRLFDGNNTNNTSYQNISDNDYNNYFTISKEELKNKINKHFIDVQESWMNFNYDDLRKLCTDELYNQYKTQLETLKLKNEQNIMNDFNVKEVSIYDIKKVNNIIEISVYLDIKFRDYVINTINNKVVRGNKKIYFNNSYELTFVMSNNNKITNCHSCGAQVEVISSNVCPYCKNTIVQTSEELVLSKKKIVSSRKTNS